MEKYYILCVAGQSNAVGYDESIISASYLSAFQSSRIKQLGLYGTDNLKMIPLGACAQNFQDLRSYGHDESVEAGTKGIHLPLASILLPLIPNDATILVLPCAYGGTGFTCGELGHYDESRLAPAEGRLRWSENSPYYRAIKDRISYILDASPDNRFLRMIWCQGEQDEANPTDHRRAFERMTQDFFHYFQQNYPGRVYKGDWNRNCWYNMETTHYWHSLTGCQQIWDAYKSWNPNTYVEIPRETYTNMVNGTGKTARNRDAHFGNNAYADVVAPLVAAAIRKNMSKE